MIKDFKTHITLTEFRKRNLKIQKLCVCVCGGGGGGGGVGGGVQIWHK